MPVNSETIRGRQLRLQARGLSYRLEGVWVCVLTASVDDSVGDHSTEVIEDECQWKRATGSDELKDRKSQTRKDPSSAPVTTR